MRDNELRKLDAWIAEHVMEYKRGHPPGCKTECWQPPPYKFGVIPVEQLPQFSTDPAAAMDVLKRCLDETELKIISHSRGYGIVGKRDVVAPTLELAICLFAKAIYSK